jgi:isopentenyl-diphosphate delta-isomerase
LNSKNEIMLQQRAHQKYHSPLLWTNTCCSHQRKGRVRLVVEDYLKKWVLKRSSRAFHFIYKAPFDNGLTEHEFDHVMIGYYDENPL